VGVWCYVPVVLMEYQLTCCNTHKSSDCPVLVYAALLLGTRQRIHADPSPGADGGGSAAPVVRLGTGLGPRNDVLS
jgi:hypothetical protein